MDSRDSFSKLFRKLEHKPADGSRKRDGRSASENHEEGREAGIGGNNDLRRGSRLRPGAGDAAKSEPNRERSDVDRGRVDRVDSTISAPSISHNDKPDGM